MNLKSKILFLQKTNQTINPCQLKCDDTDGIPVISCWKLTFKERIILLITEKIWMNLVSFGKPLTPSHLSVNKWDYLNKQVLKKN